MEALTLKIHAVPLEADVYSLCIPTLYRDFKLAKPGTTTAESPGILGHVADAVMACESASEASMRQVEHRNNLQVYRQLASLTPSIQSKGEAAQIVYDNLIQKRLAKYPLLENPGSEERGLVFRCREPGCRRNAVPRGVGSNGKCCVHEGWYEGAGLTTEEAALPEPAFDHLVLIDRQVDLVTAMLHQHTYAGLIDEVFGSPYKLLEELKEPFAKLIVEKGLQIRDLCFNSADPVWEELPNPNPSP